MNRLILFVISLAACLAGSETALANWSLNLGYNNPPGASLGVNFLYRGSKIGFEVGIGWVDADAKVEDDDSDDEDGEDDDDEETSAGLALAGDLNVKYFFSGGGVAPYIQGGFGAAVSGKVGDGGGANAGLGGGFAGVGLMAGGNDLYLYLSANVAGSTDNLFYQVGVGFDI